MKQNLSGASRGVNDKGVYNQGAIANIEGVFTTGVNLSFQQLKRNSVELDTKQANKNKSKYKHIFQNVKCDIDWKMFDGWFLAEQITHSTSIDQVCHLKL